MDLCLACRACEDVCPSHVPFGRMIERARVQIEPLRSPSARAGRWLGLDVVLPRPRLLSIATTLAPLARRLLPSRLRSLLAGVPPRPRGARLPERTDPPADVAPRGTVVLLRGCVQDRWFREVNLASIRVLASNGWRVVVPPDQACCGALPAHHGRLRTARRLAARNLLALDCDARIVVNAAGCSAHMKEYGDLLPDDERAARTAARVLDLMEFLHDTGVVPPEHGAGVDRVAVHDPCHALRAQRIHEQPRAVLAGIPGVEIVEIPNGDRCCGAAGLYNLLQPEMADELMRQKADGIERTGARVVASANPGCTMQISAGLRARGRNVEVLHPVELLARAYAGADPP
jgi:glycolate oxidase iron-sulfur subunit